MLDPELVRRASAHSVRKSFVKETIPHPVSTPDQLSNPAALDLFRAKG